MNTLKWRGILESRALCQVMLALALIGCSSRPGDLFGSTGHAGSGAGSGTNSDSKPGSGGTFNTFNTGGTADSSGTSNTASNPAVGGGTGGRSNEEAVAGAASAAVAQMSGGGPSGPSSEGTDPAGQSDAGAGPSATVQILSIDFVGGAVAKTLPAEVAGVKPASHWNSAAGASGSLSALVLADGSESPTAVTWDSSGVFSVGYVDAPGDTRMMNGYLDPNFVNSPAKITVTALPTQITSQGYDVYVYAYAEINPSGWIRTYQYSIADESIAMTQSGPSEHAFSGYSAAPAGGAGNYVVFRNLSASSFTLLATPGVVVNGIGERAPVNGIQIVSPSGT